MMGMEHLGNRELLKQQKTAFLASNTIAPDVVLRCYDWATGEHEGCVVSGFSSRLEQDVLHFLLKSKTPVIMVLARRMYREIPEEPQSAIGSRPAAHHLHVSVSTSVAHHCIGSKSLHLRDCRPDHDGRRNRRQQSLRTTRGVQK